MRRLILSQISKKTTIKMTLFFVVLILFTIFGYTNMGAGMAKKSDMTTYEDVVYVYNKSGKEYISKRTLTLTKDGEFELFYSPLSSYKCLGEYTPDNDMIILSTHDKQYEFVFKKDSEDLVFVAEDSLPPSDFFSGSGEVRFSPDNSDG